MIWVLPEVLFKDDDKDIQIYEDEPDPIFKLNFIQKFANTKLAKYTQSFYKRAFEYIYSQFKPWLDYITEFVLSDNDKKLKEPPLFIIDDTDDEDYVAQVEDEDEESFSFLKWIKGIGTFIKKIRQFIKRVRQIWKKFKKAKKYLKKKFKNAFKKFRRGMKRMRTRFRMLKRRAKRFYKKVLRPWWKKFKKKVWRWCKKLKRILRRVLKKWKKVLKIFKRRLTKVLKKTVQKFLKKFAKKIFKKVIQQLIKWLAGAISATGVGAVIGVALFAAAFAWEAYDLVHDDDEDVAGKGMEGQPVKENKRQVVQKAQEDYKPPLIETQRTLMADGMQINMMTKLQVNQHIEKIHDKVSKALFNSRSLPYQIFGRLYIFWLLCNNWLQGQQTMVTNLMGVLPDRTNHYFDELMGWTDSKEVKDLPDATHQRYDKFKMLEKDAEEGKWSKLDARRMQQQRQRWYRKLNFSGLTQWQQTKYFMNKKPGIKKLYDSFYEIHKFMVNSKTRKVSHRRILKYMPWFQVHVGSFGGGIIYKITGNGKYTEVKASWWRNLLLSGEGRKPHISAKEAEEDDKEETTRKMPELKKDKISDIFKSYTDAKAIKNKLMKERFNLIKQIEEMLDKLGAESAI